MSDKLTKEKIREYQPIEGFYDLRAFDIPTNQFVKFWRVQRFLFKVETDRRKGIIHPQIDGIRQLSANYQQALFSHPVIDESLL